MQSLRYAVRALAMRPGFSLLVIAIVALCIGGNASIFSAAKAVLFQQLPYQGVDRLVIFSLMDIPDSEETDMSWIEAADWKQRATQMEELSPFLSWRDRILIEGDAVERIGINYVTPSYFKLLGVRPELGRLFSPQENGAPGSAPVIILGYPLWARHFAKDPGVIGKRVQLNNAFYTVVGVMPAEFVDFIHGHYKIDAWIPAVQAGEAISRGNALFKGRGERYWYGLARLKPGVTLEQARREVAIIAAQMQREFPDTNRDYGARLRPLRAFMFEDLHSGMRILLAGAVFVLLIGCANVANLMLVRLTERRRELSMRLALGASRLSLVREVVLQSLLLAVAGGAIGVVLATWGTRLLARLVELPAYVHIQLDGGVLAVAAAATVLTGILFGLPPALSVAHMDSRGTLQQIKASGGKGAISSKSRSGLLVFQVAVVAVLLVVAGLLMHSFVRLRAAGVDFPTDRLLTMRLAFATQKYQEPARIVLAEREILRRFEGVPGVSGAAMWGPGMPGINANYFDLKQETAGAKDPTIHSNAHFISPGTLRMLGVPLLRGREFTWQDGPGKPRVVIISESLGKVLWPGQDPLGKRLLRANREGERPWAVVGVIRNARFQGRLDESGHHIMFPQDQEPRANTNLLVRTGTDAASMTMTLRNVIKQVDPQVPIYDAVTLTQRLHEQEGGHRLNAAVVGVFSLLALLLAVLGLYGVLAYSVAQRTREIGLRMALGAGRAKVMAMVMVWGLLLVAFGLAVGLGGALAVSRLMSSQLYGVQAVDPLTFGSVIVVFAVVALVATYLPARRAAKVEPTVALRFE